MLDWLINKDVASSKIGITIYNDDTDEVLYRQSKYHSNFFNGTITNRAVKHLIEDAIDWAREKGHDALADLMERAI